MANHTNWLNISSMSGSSGQTILTLSANTNYVTDDKVAIVKAYNPVYNISATTTVRISAYTPTIALSPTLIGVPASGGTYELNISANCSYVIAFPDIVSSYSTSAGTGNTTITFTVSGTSADTTLVGNIVVTDVSGQLSRTARVEQYGAGANIGYGPGVIYIPASGGSATFAVTANCVYDVYATSGTNWCYVNPGSGYTGTTSFTVTAPEYTGTTDKDGYIVIDGPGTAGGVVQVIQKAPETRLVVTYYVESTTEPTQILYDTGSFSKAEYPDGTQITLGTGYTFPSTGLQSVYYTLTGTSIGRNSFNGADGNSKLKYTVEKVYIPKGVTNIDSSAFFCDLSLSAVTLPNTLTGIGSYAFYWAKMSSITFPDGLVNIGANAFSYTYRLSSVTIPSSVTSIGGGCFVGSSASSFTFTSLTPPTLGATNALSSSNLTEIIVPCPAVNDYITAWPQYAQYISCNDTGTTLYFITDTSNVKGVGETRTITILNTNINSNRIGLNLPSAFPEQGAYTVSGNVIYLTYPANPSSSSTRSWTIGVVAQTNDGVSLSGSYNITQNANVLYSIPYTANTSTVDASGETRTITIDASNLVASSITIGVEGATGVTYTYNNGVITVVFPENTGFEQDVIVTITGETLTGNSAYVSVPYVQDGEYIIPTGDSRLIVFYNVTSTTSYTPILYLSGNSNSFSKAELNGTSSITMNKTFKFARKGKQAIFYTLKNNVLGRTGSGADLFRGDFYNVDSIESVIIPSSVTELNANCLSTLPNLTSVTIPSSVTVIGGSAFEYDSSLTGCVLSNNVVSIGPNCFSGCSSLTTFSIPDSVTSTIAGWFSDCTSLSSVTIGSGITSFGDTDYILPDSSGTIAAQGGYAFCGCTSLTGIVIPNTVTNIGNHSFENCSSLLSVSIGTGVTLVGSSAFKNCVSLTSITLPNTVLSLANDGFYGCTSLSNVTLSNNLYSLGGNRAYTSSPRPTGCFENCTSLTNISIPASVCFIGSYCFVGCSALTNVSMTTGIQSIKDCAFSGCTSLPSVTLPSTITNLGGWIFADASSLSSITAYPSQPPITHYTFDDINTGGVLYYQSGTNYSSWLAEYVANDGGSSSYAFGLGHYGWTGQTI